MLNNFTDIQAKCENLNPLHKAIKEGKYEAVEDELGSGTDINAPAYAGGDLPLFKAIRYKHCDIVELLISKGAEVKDVYDSSGLSPLAVACASNETRSAELILAAGVDVNEPLTVDQVTALHVAIMESKPEIVELLLKKGADVHCSDWDGVSPMDLAQQRNCLEINKLIKKEKRHYGIENQSFCCLLKFLGFF